MAQQRGEQPRQDDLQQHGGGGQERDAPEQARARGEVHGDPSYLKARNRGNADTPKGAL